MTFPMYGLGFEPVLKLYSGGLKVGEAMARGGEIRAFCF